MGDFDINGVAGDWGNYADLGHDSIQTIEIVDGLAQPAEVKVLGGAYKTIMQAAESDAIDIWREYRAVDDDRVCERIAGALASIWNSGVEPCDAPLNQHRIQISFDPTAMDGIHLAFVRKVDLIPAMEMMRSALAQGLILPAYLTARSEQDTHVPRKSRADGLDLSAADLGDGSMEDDDGPRDEGQHSRAGRDQAKSNRRK